MLPLTSFHLAVEEVHESLTNFQFYVSKSSDSAQLSTLKNSVDLDEALKLASKEKEPVHITKSIKCNDDLLYIYTSGTTGLPKAVIIKHVR